MDGERSALIDAIREMTGEIRAQRADLRDLTRELRGSHEKLKRKAGANDDPKQLAAKVFQFPKKQK